MSLVVGAINKLLKNLTSATKKRDPHTFRSRLSLIQEMIIRELDRTKVSSTTLTKTEDIQTTLTMVKDQLAELKKSTSIGKQDPMTSAQWDNIISTHKSIRKLMGSIKGKVIEGQEKLRRRSLSGSAPRKSADKDQNQ